MNDRNINWVGLTSRSNDWAELDGNWLEEYRRQYCCPECNHRQKRYSGNPVNAVFIERPPKLPLTGIIGAPAILVQRDFYRLFEDIYSDFNVIGQVSSSDGQVYEDYLTLTDLSRLVLRGSAESTRGYCSTCGRLKYYPMPHGQGYIYKPSLTPGRMFYLSTIVDCILPEELLSRVDLKIRKKLRIEQIPVRDDVEDGIVEYPENWM